MKEQWTSPSLRVQTFAPQEYVAACGNGGKIYYAVRVEDLSFIGNYGGEVYKDINKNGKIDYDVDIQVTGWQQQVQEHYTFNYNGTKYLMLNSPGEAGVYHLWNNQTQPPTEISGKCWIAEAMSTSGYNRSGDDFTKWTWEPNAWAWYTIDKQINVITIGNAS